MRRAYSGQRVEDGRQKAEDGRQMTEDSVEIKIKRISNSKIQMLQMRFNRLFDWICQPPYKAQTCVFGAKIGNFCGV